jgi:hypothetical protein
VEKDFAGFIGAVDLIIDWVFGRAGKQIAVNRKQKTKERGELVE